MVTRGYQDNFSRQTTNCKLLEYHRFKTNSGDGYLLAGDTLDWWGVGVLGCWGVGVWLSEIGCQLQSYVARGDDQGERKLQRF
jgi:hypothetical protein